MLAKRAPPLRNALMVLLAAGELDLPPPGGGETFRRLGALYRFGEQDLSLARLAEAHTDAVAILAEAGCTPISGALYGVWASDSPDSRVDTEIIERGGATLHGTKRFCSAADIVDAALITAHEGDAMKAMRWGNLAILEQSAREIDKDASSVTDARERAYFVRHLIERSCTEVLDRFGRATGPQLLAFDAAIAQRHCELGLYIRQCHAERDLEKVA